MKISIYNSRRLAAAIEAATSEAQRLDIFAEDIASSFFLRYQTPGCSVEQAAGVDCPWGTPAAFGLARAKVVAKIETGWGREAADRWDAKLRPIWG
jgi:hypothetical protein